MEFPGSVVLGTLPWRYRSPMTPIACPRSSHQTDVRSPRSVPIAGWESLEWPAVAVSTALDMCCEACPFETVDDGRGFRMRGDAARALAERRERGCSGGVECPGGVIELQGFHRNGNRGWPCVGAAHCVPGSKATNASGGFLGSGWSLGTKGGWRNGVQQWRTLASMTRESSNRFVTYLDEE